MNHPVLSRDALRARGLLTRLVRDGQQVATESKLIAHPTTLRRLSELGLIVVIRRPRPKRTCVQVTDAGRAEVESRNG